MNKVISGIVISALVPFKAINLFLQFEEAQANVRKLTGSQKMTDKIKVWKCTGCGHRCKIEIISTATKPNCPYRGPIVLRADFKSEAMHADDPRHIHQGNEGRTTAPPADTPPRKRVKIIWSEITTPAHIEAAHQILQKMSDGDIMTQKIIDSLPSDFADYFPESWLEDIPAEPVSADYNEIVSAAIFPIELTSKKTCYYYGFLNGEANNELRHAPRQTFDEWWTEIIDTLPRRVAHFHHIAREDALQLWQASARNLGHDPTN